MGQGRGIGSGRQKLPHVSQRCSQEPNDAAAQSHSGQYQYDRPKFCPRRPPWPLVLPVGGRSADLSDLKAGIRLPCGLLSCLDVLTQQGHRVSPVQDAAAKVLEPVNIVRAAMHLLKRPFLMCQLISHMAELLELGKIALPVWDGAGIHPCRGFHILDIACDAGGLINVAAQLIKPLEFLEKFFIIRIYVVLL